MKTSKSIRTVSITHELIVQMLRTGHVLPAHRIVQGLPDDARIIGGQCRRNAGLYGHPPKTIAVELTIWGSFQPQDGDPYSIIVERLTDNADTVKG